MKLSVLEVLKLKRFSQAKSLSLSLYEAFSSNTKSPAMYFLANSVGLTLHPRFRGGGYTLKDVEAVVAECPKQRFSLKTTPEVSQRWPSFLFYGWVIFLRGACLFEPTRDIPSVLWRWHLHSLNPKIKGIQSWALRTKNKKVILGRVGRDFGSIASARCDSRNIPQVRKHIHHRISNLIINNVIHYFYSSISNSIYNVTQELEWNQKWGSE